MNWKVPALLTVVIALSAPDSASAATPRFENPIVRQRADPWIWRHSDDYYYFTATVPEYDRLELRRARTIAELASAAPVVIWRKRTAGIMGAHIWAPEIHHIDGKWYIYFAAGGAERIWDIRMYALENTSANPLEGQWIEKGQIRTKWESFSLDATTFEHRGRRYLVWAQRDPSIQNNTDLYLAEMDTPWSITGEQVMISRPQLAWETRRYRVNEGPAVLKRHGRIFITYSASGTGAEYCMGMLTAADDADLLGLSSWIKAPDPVFQASEVNAVFGPGHNSFTTLTTPEGEVDLLVYHGRSYSEIEGDPLRDPNRHTRVQAFVWKPDGTPDFGQPEPDSPSFSLRLWPDGPPGARSDPAYAEAMVFRDNDPNKPRYSKVTDPGLVVFLPEPERATGAAVVVCPGGGYNMLAYDHEGLQVARWFTRHGIAAVVLKYRLPHEAIMEDRSIGPLQDAQEAIRTVRRNAVTWGIDPARIGVMGFSAGGHLAATASTLFAEKVYPPSDNVSARPDFSILVYPVISLRPEFGHGGSRRNLLGLDPDPAQVARFSPDEQARPDTPPAFLIHSADDRSVPVENSMRYFNALRAHGVPAGLHVYPRGGHGYGLGVNPDSPFTWPEALKAWLRDGGWWPGRPRG